MKIINKDLLLAAKFAAQNDLRPVLAGVQVNNDCLVATDSYKLIKIDLKGGEVAEFPTDNKIVKLENVVEPFLLPAAQLLKKLKFAKNKTMPILEGGVLCNDSADKVSIFTTDIKTSNTLEFRKIKGQFPEWERIIPTSEPVASGYFDADLLIEALQALKCSTGRSGVKIDLFGFMELAVIKGTETENSHISTYVMPIKKSSNN